MSLPDQPNSPATREKVQGRLRHVTRAAVLAAAGATVGIGIVVAHDHPGASGAGTSASNGSHSATTNTGDGSTSNTGEGSTSANTGSTGNTGGFSTAPSSSSSTPAVTSGGTSR
ncbi:MAG TPA: hypothetical protein VG244_05905 [Acidimicrobiales bacterium]|nr:hypothetical protein [Acidimicrobiales bacterium]